MSVTLAVAGVACALMAVGHSAIGTRWVLPALPEERLPTTPFGPAAMTRVMLRVSWHIVSIFSTALAVAFLILAVDTDADAATVFLRSFAVMWLATAVMAFVFSGVRRNFFRSLVRLPVPVVWVTVAVLCWSAAG